MVNAFLHTHGVRFGLFADPGLVASQLLEHLNGWVPGCGHLFPLSLAGSRLSLDADAVCWDGIDLTALDAVWIHGFTYQSPILPAAASNRDWSLWQYDHLVAQQAYSTLFSLFQDLERRGVRVINAPRVQVRNFTLFAQLEGLRHAGFQVPRMICSNHREPVEAFCRAHETVLWRPTCGRGGWQRFTRKQCAALVSPEQPPILLAQGVPGPLTRSYLFEGKSLLSLQSRLPDPAPAMERLEQFWQVPCTHVPHPGRLLQEVGGHWLMLRYVHNETGTWIYDVDTDPELSALPEPFRHYLLTVLAAEMTGQTDTTQAMANLAMPHERSTMFLRRMLRILFDMEQSKYT